MRERFKVRKVEQELIYRLKEIVLHHDLDYYYELHSSELHNLDRIRAKAIELLLILQPQESGLSSWLKNIAKQDISRFEVLSLVQTEAHEWIRRIAIEAIGQGWSDDSSTLPFLFNIASCDNNIWVRRTTVEIIERHWKDDKKT